jgi:hypothetical protein
MVDISSPFQGAKRSRWMISCLQVLNVSFRGIVIIVGVQVREKGFKKSKQGIIGNFKFSCEPFRQVIGLLFCCAVFASNTRKLILIVFPTLSFLFLKIKDIIGTFLVSGLVILRGMKSLETDADGILFALLESSLLLGSSVN